MNISKPTPSASRIKKTILIDPSVWRQIEQIIEREEAYQQNVMHHIIELGIESYNESRLVQAEMMKNEEEPTPWLFDD